MKKLVWLDDSPESISYEKDVLVPEILKGYEYKINFFETIRELMEFLYHHAGEVRDEGIFVIDIMLMENEMILPNGNEVEIPDELMAGTIVYIDYLRDAFPQTPVILYTSREHEGEIFQNIIHDPRYGETLFLVDKWKKDADFIGVIAKLLKET
jgi:hypothetical protein